MLTRGLTPSRVLVLVWLFPAAVAVVALLVTRRSSNATRKRVVYTVQLLVLAYLVGAVLVTLWPLQIDVSLARMLQRGNWIPFKGTLGFLTSDNDLQVAIGRRDALANVALFMPLGVLVPLVVRRWSGIVILGVVVAAIAFGLELVQGLAIVGRTFDIDDAIVSGAGAAAALVVGTFLRPVTGPPV
jgi:glycopeptide antibiotics resistance protein